VPFRSACCHLSMGSRCLVRISTAVVQTGEWPVVITAAGRAVIHDGGGRTP
jgi:hypothetical protein